MRRPLCLIGMAFVAVLLLGIFFVPHSARTYEETDAEQVVVLGVVEWKERKISKEEEVLVVSLGQVFVPEPGQTAEFKQLLTNQENLPGTFRGNTLKQIRKYSKKEDESLRLPGTEGIEGVLCYLDGEEPAMGSIVLMEGKFYAFSHATNPGEFDAADYYRIMGQQGRLMKAKCLAQSSEFSVFREGLYQCRTYLSLLLRACCPERAADIMAAMLLGEKDALDEEIKSLYQQNGIIHILAISGVKMLSLVSPCSLKKPVNWAFVKLHIAESYIIFEGFLGKYLRIVLVGVEGDKGSEYNLAKVSTILQKQIKFSKSYTVQQKENKRMAYKEYRKLTVLEQLGYR